MIHKEERPTFMQLQHRLKKEYLTELQLRSRKGDNNSESDSRSTVGTVMDTCNGMGELFEVDTTIADIYLVAEEHKKRVIGRPTLVSINESFCSIQPVEANNGLHLVGGHQ